MQDIRREVYLSRIAPFMNKPVIKVITGMRRVGKSSLVRLLIQNLRDSGVPDSSILYLNLESLEWDSLRSYQDLNGKIRTYFETVASPRYVFLDEVQEIPGWERVVNSLLTQEFADVTITGSNAHLLASELATYLSGRTVEFPIYPLGFSEFLAFRGTKARGVREEFQLFLRYGGLPGLHHFDFDDSTVFAYLHGIYNTLILKDVVNRNAVRDPGQLDLITRFAFDNCGNILTAKRIADYLKNQRIPAGVEKVMNYLGFLEQAFLLHKVRRFDIKGLKNLELYEKYYMGDIGLRHGLLGYRDNDISGLLENIVYLELRRRGFEVFVGKFDVREVDFVAERRGKRLYVQVCWQLSSHETIEREFSVLERIKDNHEKIVVSMEQFQTIDRGGIRHVYLLDFLLEHEAEN
ncbi:MAG: ATP-binding protein [Spirochaetales bacterium]